MLVLVGVRSNHLLLNNSSIQVVSLSRYWSMTSSFRRMRISIWVLNWAKLVIFCLSLHQQWTHLNNNPNLRAFSLEVASNNHNSTWKNWWWMGISRRSATRSSRRKMGSIRSGLKIFTTKRRRRYLYLKLGWVDRGETWRNYCCIQSGVSSQRPKIIVLRSSVWIK